MDRSREILSTDTEEDEALPPPAKKPRKVRKPRRPNNSERLDRLEQMIEKLVNQRETAPQLLPGPSTSAGIGTSNHEELQSSNIIAGASIIPNTHTLPSASQANNLNGSSAVGSLLNINNNTGNSAELSTSVSDSVKVVGTPILSVVSQKDQSHVDCGNTMRFIGKPENLPKFDGSTNTMSLQTWLHRLESLAKIYGWDEKTLIYHMTANLEGNALLWFGHEQNIDISWSDWKKRLTEYFPANRGLAAKLHELVTTNKRRDEQYKSVLHPRHSTMLCVEHALSQLYGRGVNDLPRGILERKVECSRHVLDTLDVITPGDSRMRGMMLYELHAPLMYLARGEFGAGIITKEKLKERLQEPLQCLSDAARILCRENPHSPEGITGNIALRSMEQLKATLEGL